MAHIAIGNQGPIERKLTDPETGQHETFVFTGQSTTGYGPPDDWPLMEKLGSLTSGNGAWEWHSAFPPAWVDGNEDAAALVAAVAEHYGCHVGRPDDWVDDIGDREQVCGATASDANGRHLCMAAVEHDGDHEALDGRTWSPADGPATVLVEEADA